MSIFLIVVLIALSILCLVWTHLAVYTIGQIKGLNTAMKIHNEVWHK